MDKSSVIPAGSLENISADPQNRNSLKIREKQKEESGSIMTKRYIKRQMNAKWDMPNIYLEFDRMRMKDKGTKPVTIITYFDKKRHRFPTGVDLAVNDWDSDKKIVRKTNKQAANLNLIIRNQVAKLNDLFVKYTLQNVP